MIESAKFARKVVAAVEENHRTAGMMLGFGQIEAEDYIRAKGYIAGIEGPEVTALLERLEILAKAAPPNAMAMYIEQALKRYHSAVEK